MISKRKLIFGLLYGLAAGLSFLLFAFGLDAFELSNAHLAFPWLALEVSFLPVLILSGAAGYLTVRLERPWFGILLWIVTGITLGVLGVFVPLKVVPGLQPVFNPILKSWLEFNWVDAYWLFVYSIATVCVLVFSILGLLENVLVEQAAFSVYNGSIILPLVVCILAGGVAGGVSDNMINLRYRKSAQALDRLFNYAIENKGKTIDPAISRAWHMSAVSIIDPYLDQNRRMFYFSFSETAEQGKILVELDQHWAICDVVLDQPVFCNLATPPGNSTP